MRRSYPQTLGGRRTTRGFLCALLALLLAAGGASARQSADIGDTDHDRANWERVSAIGLDKEIEVDYRSSDRSSATIRTDRGRLQKWEPDALVLQLGTGAQKAIGKPLVQRVRLNEKGRRGSAAAIGGAVGFGAGMGIGVASFSSLDKYGGTGQKIGLGTAFGLLFGGVGALIGRAAVGTRMMTVYQAR